MREYLKFPSKNRNDGSIMRLPILLTGALTPWVGAINIEIDYSYDTNGWFNPAERRLALEKAAEFYENLISDTLLRIDPSEFSQASWTVSVRNPQTGGTVSLTNPVVPEDTIIVFAGARELGGNVRGQGGNSGYSAGGFNSWFSRIRARGNPGADVSQPSQATDYAPSFGFVSFDTTTDFNFSLTQNLSGTDFIPVALHELGHVLGIGIADSWDNLISGSVFTGPASNEAAGGNPAVQAGGGHFNQSVSNKPAYGSFGTPHGTSAPVMMRPSLESISGILTVASDLDLAALVDIGWEVTPPINPSYPSLGPTSTEITWPSSSFRDYVIEKTTDLDFASPITYSEDGDGSVISWTDPSPTPGRAFYRIQSTPDGAPSALAAPLQMSTAAEKDVYRTIEVEPRWVEGCGCDGH